MFCFLPLLYAGVDILLRPFSSWHSQFPVSPRSLIPTFFFLRKYSVVLAKFLHFLQELFLTDKIIIGDFVFTRQQASWRCLHCKLQKVFHLFSTGDSSSRSTCCITGVTFLYFACVCIVTNSSCVLFLMSYYIQ